LDGSIGTGSEYPMDFFSFSLFSLWII
jgi:hypothetical protein